MKGKRAFKMTTDNYTYEKIVESDIDKAKKFELALGGAKRVVLEGCEGEKFRIRLASDTLSAIENNLVVKVDDVRRGMDVEVSRSEEVSEISLKEGLVIFVQLPAKYVRKAELSVNAETVEICSLECDSIELNVRANNVVIDGVAGAVEIDCSLDLNVDCRDLKGEIAINQVSAASRICVPESMAFTAVTKGIGTHIYYEKDGKSAAAFDSPKAENVIELNGMKSELTICTSK